MKRVELPTEGEAPSIGELKTLVNQHILEIKKLLGSRASVIVAVAISYDEHDRFAANASGPCLVTRGLNMWTARTVDDLIDGWDRGEIVPLPNAKALP